jgi:hypothetical protein
LDFGFDRERLQRIGREMVQQDIYSQEGELTMSLPVGEVSATVGAPSMDVDRRRLQEEIVDLLGEGVYRFDSRRRRSSPTARRPRRPAPRPRSSRSGDGATSG